MKAYPSIRFPADGSGFCVVLYFVPTEFFISHEPFFQGVTSPAIRYIAYGSFNPLGMASYSKGRKSLDGKWVRLKVPSGRNPVIFPGSHRVTTPGRLIAPRLFTQSYSNHHSVFRGFRQRILVFYCCYFPTPGRLR